MARQEISIPDFSLPRAQPFLFERGSHAVLLVHGYTGSVSHLRLVGEGLAERNFTVQGINLPGHAKNLDAMKKTGWADWLGASRNALLALKQRYATVTVLGLSMGGVISLILAEEGLPDAVVPVSAPMGVQNPLMPLAGVLSLVRPYFSWSSGEPTPQEKLIIPEYNLGYGGFPTRCAVDLSKLINQARANLDKITCPVLAIQSRADETISADSADIIMNGIRSRNKRVLWLEGLPHVCTATPGVPRIVAEVSDFLRSVKSAEDAR